MQIINVDEKFDNKKIYDFITYKYPNLNKNTLYKALRKKDIRVNDKRINDNVIVHLNDEIKIYITDDLLQNINNNSNSNGNNTINVVYEDDNILVINKPSGIEVTGSNSLTTMCENYINNNSNNNYIKPCHRLDRNTTGLVLFAKNEETENILVQKFKDREIDKYYKATVYGIPKNKQERLEAYLFKDNKKSLVYISDTPKKGYQKIITSYKVIQEDKQNNTSILDVKLETGRTHQIRAHLAHIGYPIIGDGKYGVNEINKRFNQKKQLLQSYKLKFNFTTNSGILEYLNHKEFIID